MRVFKSQLHNVSSVCQNKTSLSSFFDNDSRQTVTFKKIAATNNQQLYTTYLREKVLSSFNSKRIFIQQLLTMPDHISTYEDANDMGYILEVDLEYPKEIHSKHSEYPMAAEKLKVFFNFVFES